MWVCILHMYRFVKRVVPISTRMCFWSFGKYMFLTATGRKPYMNLCWSFSGFSAATPSIDYVRESFQRTDFATASQR